jgi:hypothetical protein
MKLKKRLNNVIMKSHGLHQKKKMIICHNLLVEKLNYMNSGLRESMIPCFMREGREVQVLAKIRNLVKIKIMEGRNSPC